MARTNCRFLPRQCPRGADDDARGTLRVNRHDGNDRELRVAGSCSPVVGPDTRFDERNPVGANAAVTIRPPTAMGTVHEIGPTDRARRVKGRPKAERGTERSGVPQRALGAPGQIRAHHGSGRPVAGLIANERGSVALRRSRVDGVIC